VDDGLRSDGQHSVGNDTRVMLDSMGTVLIVHQDGRAVAMAMARRMGPNSWTLMDVPAPLSITGHGFFPRLAADGTSLWVSDFYFDRNVKPFGKLEVVKVQ